VIVSSVDGRLLRREPDGTLLAHADLGQPGWNDILVDGRGNVYVNRGGCPRWSGRRFDLAPSSWSRRTARYARRPRTSRSQRDGRDGRQLHADRHGLYRHSLVALISARTAAVQPTRPPRTGRGCAEGHPRGRVEGCLVRRRAQPAVRACRRGRDGTAGGRAGPRWLRLRVGRARRADAVHRGEWWGMTESEMVTPGTGEVFTTQVDAPRGWS
jgi:hypothetical protein